MPADPVVNQIQTLLNLWSKRADRGSRKSQSPLSGPTLKVRDFLKILKHILGAPFNYDQFRNYYDSNPDIQKKIKNLDRSEITILLPDEEPETEMQPELPAELAEPESGTEVEAAEAEPEIEQPEEVEPEKTGPGSRSVVAQMAKRAQQRSRK
jgi:hypothetical protein